MDRKQHWEQVYATSPSDRMSWFQIEPTTSLRLLEATGLTAHTWLIDIGGGDSRLVDALVSRGLSCLTVLDVSGTALARGRERLGPGSSRVRWLEADVTGQWSAPPMDLWHDRAVFHFLMEPGDRAAYLDRLRSTLKPGGTVILVTFALDGPARCSGLPVRRYSPELLQVELGAEFELAESAHEAHLTPSGAMQSFTYSLFVRAT